MRQLSACVDAEGGHHRQRTTGSALALHCCKAHAKINRKTENSTPCIIVTPKHFILKVCTHDYVGEVTRQTNFGFNRYSGASPQILPPCDCLTVLTFFLDPMPRSNRWTDFQALWLKRRASAQGWSFWGLERWVTIFGGKYAPKTPPKWVWIGNFKPKQQNVKITISPKLQIGSTPNLRTKLRPAIALRGWSNITQIKSNMAAGGHLEKRIWRHNSADDRLITTKFGKQMQNDMPMTIRQNRNRKYNSNMAAVSFPKPEVVLSQLWIEISHRNLACIQISTFLNRYHH